MGCIYFETPYIYIYIYIYIYKLSSTNRLVRCINDSSVWLDTITESYWSYIVFANSLSLSLSRYVSISSIAQGKSSRLHPVPLLSWYMQVLDGQPTMVSPWVRIHKRRLFMNLSLLLQQCPAIFFRFTEIVWDMGGGNCLYACSFVWCCF